MMGNGPRYQMIRSDLGDGAFFAIYDAKAQTVIGHLENESDALLFVAAKIKADRENADANV